MTVQSGAAVAPDSREPARRPALDRAAAMRLAEEEYARVARQLSALPADAWDRPTACTGWDVSAVAGHVLGMAEMAASVREVVRQNAAAAKAAKASGATSLEELTALQVREHAHLPGSEVAARLAAVGPRAARTRRRIPGVVRRRAMPDPQPVSGRPDGPVEPWTIGFLVDVILTRDPWMHRTDIADATGVALELTADHDGVLVDDVVREWATRHGQPCRLVLSGPAGGAWTFGGLSGGTSGPAAEDVELELDAVQFCRAVSGRGPADGLLATSVPF